MTITGLVYTLVKQLPRFLSPEIKKVIGNKKFPILIEFNLQFLYYSLLSHLKINIDFFFFLFPGKERERKGEEEKEEEI